MGETLGVSVMTVHGDACAAGGATGSFMTDILGFVSGHTLLLLEMIMCLPVCSKTMDNAKVLQLQGAIVFWHQARDGLSTIEWDLHTQLF